LEEILVLKEKIEFVVLALLIAINKMGIPLRVSKRASFVLVEKFENGSFHFLLVREMFGFLNFSGGRPDKGETDQDAAKREVREESGLEVRIGKLLKEGDEVIFHGAVKLSYRIYAGKIIGGELNPCLQGAKFYSTSEIYRLDEKKLLGYYVRQTIERFTRSFGSGDGLYFSSEPKKCADCGGYLNEENTLTVHLGCRCSGINKEAIPCLICGRVHFKKDYNPVFIGEEGAYVNPIVGQVEYRKPRKE